MRKSKKNTFQMLVSGILVVVFVFVGVNVINLLKPNDGSQEYVNPDIPKVRISLDEFAGYNCLLYANGGLVTTKDSINAQNGIYIEYVVMNNANDSSAALISGDISGAGYTVNRYAFLQSKFDEAGVDVIMPYISNYSNGGDGIIANSDILSVEDLVGKKIAVPRFSEAQTLVEWLIRNSSLTPEQIEQIRGDIVYFETADDAAKAYFSGSVDAAATWEPYLTQAASSTDSRILFDTSMGTNLILSGIVFRSDFAEENPDFIVKFMDGAFKANSMYLRDFNAIRSMPMFGLMTDEEIKEMCLGASVTTWADNANLLTNTAVDMYKEMANIWISVGEVANPKKAETAFTNKYVNQLFGKYPANDITSFSFTSGGRQAASQISNNAALLSVTLNIEFEPDSYQISKASYAELNEFAKTAQILNGVYIQIEGNTAKVQGDNGVDFSYKRALSVAKYLQALGLDPARFVIIGNGDTNPIDTNDTEEGRARNRRTEVFFKVIGY